MKPEAQRIAIAEAAGQKLFVIHKQIHDPFGYYREKGHGYTTLVEAWRVTEEVGKKYIGGRPTDPDRVILEPAPLPDYPTDLNAMHEAEEALFSSRPGFYERSSVTALCAVLGLDEDTGMHDKRTIRQLLNATAAQRAEAFLRTIGKWTDD